VPQGAVAGPSGEDAEGEREDDEGEAEPPCPARQRRGPDAHEQVEDGQTEIEVREYHAEDVQREEASARHEALMQLERVGLGDKPFELAGNLPLGNQRILEIARALAADPALLVLDEPAAGLRRQEKLRLAELLRSLRADHLTILIVEHDMEFVMSLVDRIVVLDFGSKLCEGAPAAIRSDERVQEAYLGGVA